MKGKKKNIIIVGIIVAVFTIVLGIIAVWGFNSTNEASKHLRASLNYRIKGDTTEIVKLISDENEESLALKYDEFVREFVQACVGPGTDADAEIENRFVEKCKKMMLSMKFEVGESKEISSNKYEVTVTYQSTNFYERFIEACNGESKRIMEKYEKSEYRGTEAEINAQMKKEFLENAVTHFENAMGDMEYGEQQDMIFHVVKTKKGNYQIKIEEIEEFRAKILRLDEKQD